jgi:phospholipase C
MSRSRIPRLRASAVVLVMLAMTLPTLAQAGSRAAMMPIDHVVVLMQENRSYFNYFGKLHDEGQPSAEAMPADASNPDPRNGAAPPIGAFHQTDYCGLADLDHSWTGAHAEFDVGAMDGFTKRNVDPTDPTGARAMGYFDHTDLPYYYALYNTFATSDRYFSDVLGPTFPNRFYLLAGTSFGHITNDIPPNLVGGYTQKTIFNELGAAGISWRVYTTDASVAELFSYVQQNVAGHVFPLAQYFIDAASGQLPQVSYVESGGTVSDGHNTETDEHPSANIQTGEEWSSQVIGALMSSPNWSSSALFHTYDEDGGYYDYVPPPPAVVPDDIKPMLKAGDVAAQFDRYGFRVPVVVVSPYSKPHYVSHVIDDHTSILRFIEERFGLPALTRRDAAADPMLGFFDFTHPSFATPPTLPDAPIDPAHAIKCQKDSFASGPSIPSP